MTILLYIITRLCMALVALMSIDALADTALAADPWNAVAGFCLLVIAELIIEANT